MVSQYPIPVSTVVMNSGIKVDQEKKLVTRGSGFHDFIKITVKAVLNFIGAHQSGHISADDCDMMRGVEGEVELNQSLTDPSREIR